MTDPSRTSEPADDSTVAAADSAPADASATSVPAVDTAADTAADPTTADAPADPAAADPAPADPAIDAYVDHVKALADARDHEPLAPLPFREFLPRRRSMIIWLGIPLVPGLLILLLALAAALLYQFMGPDNGSSGDPVQAIIGALLLVALGIGASLAVAVLGLVWAFITWRAERGAPTTLRDRSR